MLGRALWPSIVLLLPGATYAQTAWSVRVETGGGYDSNAERAERIVGLPPPTETASPVMRTVATGSLRTRTAASDLALTAAGGAKVFAEPAARGQNTAIAQAAGRWSLRAGRSHIGPTVDYYDAFQGANASPRSFRSIDAAAQVAAATSPGTWMVSAGYRHFTFKSDADLDFGAPHAALGWLREWPSATPEGSDWDANAQLFAEWRTFGGLRACEPVDPSVPCPDERRRDSLLGGQAEVTRVRTTLGGLGYRVLAGSSNSYGESLLRHTLFVRAGVPLPAGVTATARAELAFAHYRDRAILGQDAAMQFLTIEDETGSQLHLEVSRPFGDHWEVVLRLASYGGPLGSAPVSYGRHTALLALAFQAGR